MRHNNYKYKIWAGMMIPYKIRIKPKCRLINMARAYEMLYGGGKLALCFVWHANITT